MSILATELDWPEGTKFFEVQCRLGIWDVDGWDLDKEPEVKTLGGTVRITPRTPAGRIRILEPDGRYRVVVTPPLTFAINDFTGRLVNTADNTEGVWVVDPSSDTVDPKDFTYSAVVTPKVGTPFTVEFDGTVAINGVYDLANGTTVAPSRGVSVLESRITKLETEVGQTVREVSGTVTLTTADGPLVQVYATAAATVNGEKLTTGDAALFRLVGGKWEVRVLDVDFEWRLIGTAPAPIDPNPNDGPIVVVTTPGMVSFTDVDGSDKDTYTISRVAGVLWEVSTNGGSSAAVQPGEHTTTAGATVKIVAVADSGYVISGPTEWVNTFSTESSHEWSTMIFHDTFTRPAGKLHNTTSDSGHLWVGSEYGVDKITDSGTVTPSYSHTNQGVKLWNGDISLRAKVLLASDSANLISLSLRASEAFDKIDGLNFNIEDRGDGTGRVVCAGISSVTFNQEGRMMSGKYENWTHVAGWTSGTSKEFRIDILSGLVTVYVDGTKTLEGGVNTAITGEYLRLSGTSNVALVDSLEAWA